MSERFRKLTDYLGEIAPEKLGGVEVLVTMEIEDSLEAEKAEIKAAAKADRTKVRACDWSETASGQAGVL
jgi:hypothetical protein